MQVKWIGALCVIAGCGGYGFTMALQHMRRIQFCRQFLTMLEYFACELEYRATALPQLCLQAAERTQGILQRCLITFSGELDSQIAPDPRLCMGYALEKLGRVDMFHRNILIEFAGNLGQFDVSGQIIGLNQVKQHVLEKLNALSENKDSRLRSYQTLGLCAGAALAILLV